MSVTFSSITTSFLLQYMLPLETRVATSTLVSYDRWSISNVYCGCSARYHEGECAPNGCGHWMRIRYMVSLILTSDISGSYDKYVHLIFRAMEMARLFPESEVVGFDLNEQTYPCVVFNLQRRNFISSRPKLGMPPEIFGAYRTRYSTTGK